MAEPRRGDLAQLRTVLEDGGYVVDAVELEAVSDALLAETPYALVSAISAGWDDLEERVAAAQASLTMVAAEHPSARRWDLYVLAVVPQATTPLHDALRETLESDTRYARKLLVAGARDKRSAERAVRALLPLQPPAEIPRINALEAMRAGLAEQGVDATLADAAVSTFEAQSEVRIP